jgi:hypothetical protein
MTAYAAPQIGRAAPAAGGKAPGQADAISIGGRLDPEETQADAIAREAMAGRLRSSIAGTTASGSSGAREAGSPRARIAPAGVGRALSAGGNAMPAELRRDMERRFDCDFSQVRVHADTAAATSATEIGANAYAVGNHIVFGAGRFAPETLPGRQLVAHELAHVIQQPSASHPVLRRDLAKGQSDPGGSRWDDAFALVDDHRWEEVAELVNGFSPADLRVFIQTVGEPQKIAQLHLGALGNKRLGPQSRVAMDTRVTYLDVNFHQESRKADWSRAAFYLNGFNTKDIGARLERLSTAELQSLHEGAVTNPEVGMDSSAAKVSAEVLARRSAQGDAKALLLPKVRGEGREALLEVMRVIDGIKPSPVASGLFTMTVDGQPQQLTAAQVDAVRKSSAENLRAHLRSVRVKASSAADGYNSQSEVDKKHWIVAPIVKTLGRVEDPGPKLLAFARGAARDVEAAQAAVDAGNFARAASLLASAETAAISASKMWQAYFQGIIGAGEMTVTALEITRDAAFITLAILATIATAGAAAGVAGAAGAAEGTAAATTVFGVELGVSTATAANVVAVGAPIVANFGEAGVKVAMGDKVDWGALVIDTVVQIVIARFGGKVTGGIAKAMLGNPATERLAGRVTERIVHAAIMHVGSTALMTAVQDTYRAFKGQDVTFQTVVDDVVARLTDPKSLAVFVVTGAVSTAAEIKFGGGPPAAATTGRGQGRSGNTTSPSEPAALAVSRPTASAAAKPVAALPAEPSTPPPTKVPATRSTLAPTALAPDVAPVQPSAAPRMGSVTADRDGVVAHPVSDPVVVRAPARRLGPRTIGAARADPRTDAAAGSARKAGATARSSSEEIRDVMNQEASRFAPVDRGADFAAHADDVGEHMNLRTSESTTKPERDAAAREAAARRPVPEHEPNEQSGSHAPDEPPPGGLFDDPLGGRPIPELYRRPTGFKPGVVEEVWRAAQDKHGVVRDPITKKVIDPAKPWHMGHRPGYEFRKHVASAIERGITREQFLDEHNTPEHYQPELPESNLSHAGELDEDTYHGH